MPHPLGDKFFFVCFLCCVFSSIYGTHTLTPQAIVFHFVLPHIYFIRLRTKSLTTIKPFWYGDSDNSWASRMASMQCFRARKRVCSRPWDLCTSSKARSTSPGSSKRLIIIGFSSGNWNERIGSEILCDGKTNDFMI